GEVVLCAQVQLDPVAAEPAAAAGGEHRRLGQFLKAQHPGVKAAQGVLTARRAGQLHVMDNPASGYLDVKVYRRGYPLRPLASVTAADRGNVLPAAIGDVHPQCGRELCALARVNMSGSRELSRSFRDDSPPGAGLPAPPPAAQGSCNWPAGACLRRSSEIRSRLGAQNIRPSARDVPAPAAGLCGMLPWPPCPGIPEEKSVARPGQRQTGARHSAARKRRRVHHRGDVVPVLARTVREVEAAARRGGVTPAVRTKFQAVALLLRDERARVWAAAGSDSHRAEQLKRLDGVATMLATTAVQDAGLLALLAEGSGVSDAVRSLKR